jgi:hypothetical protein
LRKNMKNFEFFGSCSEQLVEREHRGTSHFLSHFYENKISFYT